MSPPRNIDQKGIDIDSLNFSIHPSGRDNIIAAGVRVHENEKRINVFHYVIHTLAFMIIIPFLFMVFLGIKVPAEYSTIVSVVVGFYFGRALFR